MRWMMRGRGDERGAIIVLAAVLTIVMVGMAALVIDVGAILDEKRQLQNGADAAALAVARSCARGEACTQAAADTLSARLVTDNSGVNSASVVLDKAVGKVTVVATTGIGSTGVLPYNFGQVLTGQKGKTVRAKATASWGAAQRAAGIPLAITKCDLDAFRLLPPNSELLFAKSPSCGSKDAPGAFGWLDGTCQTTGAQSTWVLPTFSVGALATGDPGKSGPKDCLDGFINKDIILPVFDTVTGTGNNTTYHLIGFAAVHLTGWDFPGDSSTEGLCKGSCIKGTIINAVITGPPGVGTGFGVSTVGLTS